MPSVEPKISLYPYYSVNASEDLQRLQELFAELAPRVKVFSHNHEKVAEVVCDVHVGFDDKAIDIVINESINMVEIMPDDDIATVFFGEDGHGFQLKNGKTLCIRARSFGGTQ